MQFDAQIFLGIFPDGLDQVPGLNQHLVRVVVESIVFEQLARGALTGLEFRSQLRELRDRSVELLGQFVVLRELAQSTVAGIDLIGELLKVRNRIVRVVIKGGIFEEFSCGAFLSRVAMNLS